MKRRPVAAAAFAAAFAATLARAAAETAPPAFPATSAPPVPTAEPAAALALLDAPEEGAAAPASGAELLAACAARMPAERILLGGRLNMRKAYGVTLRAFDFRVDADFGAEPARFFYDLSDGGSNLLAVAAVRDGARGLVLSRPDGGPAPAPSEAILGTDVAWADVGFDFVWWRTPTLAGTDRLKGRTCDLLDVEPPAPTPTCAKARLWIDRDQKVVMQAAEFDALGRERRRLWVRAVQKAQGRWVVKDLEVETKGTGHRTRLHFDDVVFPDAPGDPAAAD